MLHVCTGCNYSKDACRYYNDATVWLSACTFLHTTPWASLQAELQTHTWTQGLFVLFNLRRINWRPIPGLGLICNPGLCWVWSWKPRWFLTLVCAPLCAMYESVDVVGLTPNPFLSMDYYHHQQQQKRGCLIQDKGMQRPFVPWSSSHCRWPFLSLPAFLLSYVCATTLVGLIPFLLKSTPLSVSSRWWCVALTHLEQVNCTLQERSELTLYSSLQKSRKALHHFFFFFSYDLKMSCFLPKSQFIFLMSKCIFGHKYSTILHGAS